ncbi:hypothetical protein Tco_1166889 [Tanacetum coccineum]
MKSTVVTVVTLVEEQMSSWKGLEWSGDQVKLERWQGMVRARAARSDKDGLLGVQGEEVAFFLVPKVNRGLVFLYKVQELWHQVSTRRGDTVR